MSTLPGIIDLRRQVFSAPDPSAQDTLIDELLRRESEARVDAPEEPLLKIGGASKNTLSDLPQLEVTASLRTTHIPTAIAHLLTEDANPLVTVALRNKTDEKAVLCRLSTWVEGYSATSVKTVAVHRAQGEISVSLLPTFFPKSIADLSEITAATVRFAVQKLSGEPLWESSGRIWLLPQQSVILESRDPSTGKRTDFKRYLAAYVTPNDPAVLAFLPKAAVLHPKGQLAGDRNITAENIRQQVEAVYQALKQHGVRYVNTLAAFFPEEGLSGQRVRLPRESIAAPSANCIDGVLLFASILEAISLHPALVMIPGHALVAWETERDSDKWEHIETTMLADAPFLDANNSGNRVARKFDNAKLLDRYPLRAARKSRLYPLA